MSDKGVALYHRVYAHETFEQAARAVIGLIRAAEKDSPGAPRFLFVDIDGHRNSEGGFDNDMYEFQVEFLLGCAMPFLSEVSTPLLSAANQKVVNPKPQRDGIPEGLIIFETKGAAN